MSRRPADHAGEHLYRRPHVTELRGVAALTGVTEHDDFIASVPLAFAHREGPLALAPTQSALAGGRSGAPL